MYKYSFDYALCYLLSFTLEPITLFYSCYSCSHLIPVHTKRTEGMSLTLN